MRALQTLFARTPPPPDPAGMPIPVECLRALRDDDQFLVSFPRSGNTWMRHLLHDLIVLQRPDLFAPESIESLVPALHRSLPDLTAIELFAAPRVFKSHNLRDLKGRRMIYMFREPADALVSYFHYLRRGGGALPVDSDRPDESCVWMIPSWSQHLELALEQHAAFPERTLFVSYELLLERGLPALRAVAEFLGFQLADLVLTTALERNAFATLQAKESTTLEAPAESSARFFRKGRHGSAKEELSAAAHAKITAAAGPLYERASALALAALSSKR